MASSKIDITKLANEISNQLKPYIQSLVEDEVKVIPHYVRKQFDELSGSQFRRLLREKIEETIRVHVTVRDTDVV